MHTNFWDGSRWVDESTAAAGPKPQSSLRKLTRRGASGALIATLALGLIAAPALAKGNGGGGKGGAGSATGGGTVAMVLVADANGNGAPNWNDTITYRVSTSATAFPYVSTQCKQGSTLVLSTSAGYFASYAWPWAQTFALATDTWTGGAANCTAKLYSMDGGRQSILATISFAVGA